MITWLVGENSFEVREALQKIVQAFDGTAERIDGATLRLEQLPDLLMGMSLFAQERLVIVTDLASNSAIWDKVPEWLPRVNDAIHLVLVDAKPDKRTTSYKALKSVAELHEFLAWGERDGMKAQQWLVERAKQQGVDIDKKSIQHLVERVGVDQWQLAHALDQLSLLDSISPEVIDVHIEGQVADNIFQLFETALRQQPAKTAELLRRLAAYEDPYALFALLNSQALSLAAITYAGEDNTPTKDFGIHPYVASKFEQQAKKLGTQKVGRIVEVFAQTDADLKRSKAEPWLLIERALLKIAQ